ncbi:Hydroperoxy fatty acid reductase gpx1 [Falsiruegeria litorea R37]|uniref:Glutathione peroxidase n=1 Tax=Falsiruegeria litorea R37 TaxID=1200284 RepID=A0A1Y5TX08_9RHOB|nr:glutathione peroxidase [Falsiruegeria litorea]SLN70077.1 Hydroperoxy fatty acid reductase gpx1 [Falsiruegeria litorea R37]
MIRLGILGLLLLIGHMVHAGPVRGVFDSIDGGQLSMKEWQGRPVLVVNTASQCAYTDQYVGLQKLYDRYRDRGLIVLAVPSDDFNQELDTSEDVKQFCEVNYGLDVPMTDIKSVRGSSAHPFYRQVKEDTGFEPRWNFNKVLVAPDGSVAATFGSATRPDSGKIVSAIEELLN